MATKKIGTRCRGVTGSGRELKSAAPPRRRTTGRGAPTSPRIRYSRASAAVQQEAPHQRGKTTHGRGMNKTAGPIGKTTPRSSRSKGGAGPTGPRLGDSGAPRAARARGRTATKKEDTRSRKATGRGRVIGTETPKSNRTRNGGAATSQGVCGVGAPRAAQQLAPLETWKDAPGAG